MVLGFIACSGESFGRVDNDTNDNSVFMMRSDHVEATLS